jgi:Tfp pilus assembly protein FimT
MKTDPIKFARPPSTRATPCAPWHPRRRTARGFTVMELMMGIAITAMVMGATAALMGAVGQGWQQSESTDQSASTATQAHLRLQRIIKSAKQLGYYRAGSFASPSSANGAAVLMWKADTNLDGKAQYSELAVLEYHHDADPYDAMTIRQYQILSSSTQADAQTEIDSTDYYNVLYSSTFYTQFMQRSDLAYTIVARNVAAAEFHKTDSSSKIRPAFEYVLSLKRGTSDQTEVEYGTAAERVATTLPVSQR